MKRIFSFIMAAVMVVMMIPAVVGAEEVANTAAIGNTEYATLKDAVAAVKDGETIRLLCDTLGAGIKIKNNSFVKGITIDFDGYTYTVSNSAVGSSGTETQAFQLHHSGNKADPINVTLKNGTIAADTTDGSRILWLINSYVDLELEDITLDATGLLEDYSDKCALNVRNGDVEIKGETNIIACEGHPALRVSTTESDGYTDTSVIVNTTGKIDGEVVLSDNVAILKINQGIFTDNDAKNHLTTDSNAKVYVEGTETSRFGENASNLLDGDKETKLCVPVDMKTPAFVTWTESEKIATGYKLTAANDARDYENRNPDKWILKGYIDGKWVVLDEVADQRIITNENFAEYTFKIDAPQKCSTYRFELYNGDSDDGLVQLADIELITDGTVADTQHVCDVVTGGYRYNGEEHWHGCSNRFCHNRYGVEAHDYVSVREGYKNINTCVDCGYQMITALTQGQKAVDNIKNVMKTLARRHFAVAIDCDEDAVVITNNTNTKKVVDDLGDSALYNYMADVKYSFAAAEGYEIVSVTVDGVEVDADDVLIYQIKGNHVIKVVTEKIVVEEPAVEAPADTAIAE